MRTQAFCMKHEKSNNGVQYSVLGSRTGVSVIQLSCWMKFPLGQARPEVRAEEAREEQGGELRPDPAAFQVAPVGHDAEEAHHEVLSIYLVTDWLVHL